jgi:hypothetical protein
VRRVRLFAAALWCMAVAVASLRAQSVPAASRVDSLSPVVIELAVKNAVSATTAAYRRDDVAFIPLVTLLTLADVGHASGDGRTERMTLGNGRRVVIAADAGEVDVNGVLQRTPFNPASAIVVRDGVVFVESRALAYWLGIRIDVAWSELKVTASGERVLPAQQRAVRAASRYITPFATVPSVSGTPIRTPITMLDGAVLEYALSLPVEAPFHDPAYSIGVGASLLGGSLEGLLASTGTTQQNRASWNGVWRDQRWLTQLRIGDVPATGPWPGLMRGVSVSNAPFVRPLRYGEATYGALLGRGWEVESYLGGRLVGVDSTGADGRFSFRAPVQYGSNPVDFVAYGPEGRELRFSQLFQVFPQDFLPEKRVEYGASLGACESHRICRSTGNADVRVGISSRLSLQGGLQYLDSDSAGRTGRAYLGASVVPTNDIFVQAQTLLGARTQLAARWQPSIDQSLSFSTVWLDDAPVTRAITTQSGRERYSVSYFVRPARAPSGMYFTGDASRSLSAGGSQNALRAGLGVQWHASQLLPYVQRMRTEFGGTTTDDRTAVGVNYFLMPPAGWSAALGQLLVYGTLERSNRSEQLVSFTAVRPITSMTRIEVGGRWASGASSLFTIRVLSDLPTTREISSAFVSDGRMTGTHFVSGSVIAEPRAGRFAFTPGPAIQRAGVTGRVFLDANVNGRFDDGDTPIAGALVRAGSVYALTDSAGHYRIWDLPPFEPVAIAIDVGSLDSPLWSSDVQRAVLIPTPNHLQNYDVVVVPGGVAEGTVTDERGGAHPIAGVRVQLREVGGARVREKPPIYDGGFSFLGVKPGRWTAVIAAEDQKLLRASATAVPFEVRAIENGDRVLGLQLRVRASPSP